MHLQMLYLTQTYLGKVSSIPTYVWLYRLSGILKSWYTHRKVLPGLVLKHINVSSHTLLPIVDDLMHLIEHIGEHALAPSKLFRRVKHPLQHDTPPTL